MSLGSHEELDNFDLQASYETKLKQLELRQRLPLETKVRYTQKRITDWFNYFQGNVHINFSGGKDSTVLLHIAQQIYPNIRVVFSDTGLEYPEIRQFVKSKENIHWLKPKKSFYEILSTYGYPVISKKVSRYISDIQSETNNFATKNLRITGLNRKGEMCRHHKLPKKYKNLLQAPFKCSDKCCYFLKKEPLKSYDKLYKGSKGITGEMASDSIVRKRTYLAFGCNNFTGTYTQLSKPLSFWLEEDIWDYIKKYNVPYCSIYDTGVKRTGCVFCMFGVHLEKEPNRFQCLKISHPSLYKYCIEELEMAKVLDFIGVPY